MDHFVYIRSDECDDYFKDNKPYQFKIHLKAPLVLKGFWTVGLVEFFCKINSKSKTEDVLYVFCNFCKESILNGELKPLLRRLPSTKKNQWIYSFDATFYRPVVKKEVYEMEFNIRTAAGELASFLDQPLMLTLRFKSYPFYIDYESL